MSSGLRESLKEELRERALASGFVACGFTSADPLDCGGLLDGWLAQRRHGFMDYLARDRGRRLEPRASLDAAAGVMVAAWPYAPPPPPAGDWRATLTGRIAAYALGLDYHTRLAAELDRLAAFIEERTGAASRVHVDAGPLVEKELARRAGLGWYGHNTNILTRERGSYVLLACLLTEARLAPDPPFAEDHCGTCTACVPACPTRALDDGPTIDAPRCISYLTIEHRGPIAEHLRARMENWVFGCDVCQEVCPWNEAGGAAVEALSPSLPELLAIDRDGFRDRFGATAVARAKRRGLARNAAVALGNSGNPDAADPLERALRGHDEPLVRAHAAWALGAMGTVAARIALERSRPEAQAPPVQREIELAVARLRRTGAAAAVSRSR